MKPEPILFLNDARGVYIPRDFAESISAERLSGVESDTLEILAHGPNHEFYWEAWDSVLRDGVVTDKQGVRYSIWQDGDCWLIPEGMEWNDESGFYEWPSEESADE